jgi:hypothetical protein
VPGPRRRAGRPADAGAVTAETAVLLPAVAAVLLLAVWAVGATVAQLRCVDAARVAARALARGEDPAAALDAARESAPRGARVRASRSGGLVVVDVVADIALPGPWAAAGPSLSARGRAAAAAEQP